MNNLGIISYFVEVLEPMGKMDIPKSRKFGQM